MRITLVIMAAGLGSRYGGLKQLEALGQQDETLLEYAVFDAIRAGYEQVVCVIRRDFSEEFRARVCSRFVERIATECVFQEPDDLPPGCQPRPERERPWGTAHAVWAVREVVSNPFVVINADDYYGPRAFRLAHQFLEALPSAPPVPVWCLLGYRLNRTLSPHGTVSRALVGMDVNGALVSLDEFKKVEKANGKCTAESDRSGSKRWLTGDELVSMNFFGLTPEVFPVIEEHFSAFLRKMEEVGDFKTGEFLIPELIGDLVAAKQARVEVIPTDEDWAGVTYPKDADALRARLGLEQRRGTYPATLWSGPAQDYGG